MHYHEEIFKLALSKLSCVWNKALQNLAGLMTPGTALCWHSYTESHPIPFIVQCITRMQRHKSIIYFSNKDKNILDVLTSQFLPGLTHLKWLSTLKDEHGDLLIKYWCTPLCGSKGKKNQVWDGRGEQRLHLECSELIPSALQPYCSHSEISYSCLPLLTLFFRILCRWACQLNLNSD